VARPGLLSSARKLLFLQTVIKTLHRGTALGFVGSTLLLDRTESDQRIRALTFQCSVTPAQAAQCIPPESQGMVQDLIRLDHAMGGLIDAYQSDQGVARMMGPKAMTEGEQAWTWSGG
jgi:hypothetical protein